MAGAGEGMKLEKAHSSGVAIAQPAAFACILSLYPHRASWNSYYYPAFHDEEIEDHTGIVFAPQQAVRKYYSFVHSSVTYKLLYLVKVLLCKAMPQYSWSSSGAAVMATFPQCLFTETQKGLLQIWSGLFTLQSQLETMTEWSEAEFSGKAEWDVVWERGLVPCDHSRTHLLSSWGSILFRSSDFFFFFSTQVEGSLCY